MKLSYLSWPNKALLQRMHISVDAQAFRYTDFILTAATDSEIIRSVKIRLQRLIRRLIYIIRMILL